MKRMVWYFEEGGMVLWRGWCGTLKRMVWYFEEGDVVIWRGWCGTLKRVMWYFEEGGVVIWRGWCDTLKRVGWYFEEGAHGMVLWRGWCDTLKRVIWYWQFRNTDKSNWSKLESKSRNWFISANVHTYRMIYWWSGYTTEVHFYFDVIWLCFGIV